MKFSRKHVRVVLLVAVLLGACTNTSGSTTGRDTTTSADTSQTTGEGTSDAPSVFRFATNLPDAGIDPTLLSGGGQRLLNLFEDLAVVAPSGEIELAGADEFTVSPDGVVWTFHLREDAAWSNGDPVTIEDYLFSLERMLNPTTASRAAGSYFNIVGAEAYSTGELESFDEVGIRAVDDSTIEFTLVQPDGAFLTTVATTITPVPSELVKQLGDDWATPGNIVSNGQFMVQDWVTDQSMTLVPNPHYRTPPVLTRVDVTLVAPEARNTQPLASFEAGEVDYAPVPTEDIERIRSEYPDAVRSVDIPEALMVFLDVRQPPFDDLRVRQALSLAVDRQGIQSVFEGEQAAATGLVPHGVPGYREESLPFDPEQARSLLAEAGFPNGEGFPQLTLVTFTTLARVTEAVQASWQQNLDIDVRVQSLENTTFNGGFLGGIREGDAFEMYLSGGTADTPDGWLFHNFMVGEDGNGYYPTHWTSTEYVDLITSASAEADPDLRAPLYQEADEVATKEAAIIPVTNGVRTYVTTPDFSNLELLWGPGARPAFAYWSP